MKTKHIQICRLGFDGCIDDKPYFLRSGNLTVFNDDDNISGGY